MTVALALAAAPAAAQTAGQPSFHAADTTGLAIGERIEQQALEAMELIYQGRAEAAERAIDQMEREAPEDPRPYFLRARLMRERVSEQNASRSSLKPQMKALYQVLDRCIAASQALLDRDHDSLLGTLYRGWAKMFKSQLHALAFEHWGAGQEAKAGMKDIDRVLELDPNNEEAQMVRGTYLYFAGILPSTLKLASIVFGIPRGNRERGLASLDFAANRPGLARYDAMGILGAALFGFEGRLEDAIGVLDTLNLRFPENPRLVEPIAVIDLFLPARLGQDLPRIGPAIEAGERSPDLTEIEAAARLRLYRALTEVLIGRIAAARADLEHLHRAPPDQPDWLPTDIDLYLAEVYLMLGENDLAKGLVRPAAPDTRRLLKPLLKAGREQASDAPALLLRLQPVAEAIHQGRLDEAERELDAVREPESLYLDYCRGELEFLRGRMEAARPYFERMIDRRRAGHWRLMPLIGHLRLAEVYRLEDKPDAAAVVLDEVVSTYQVKDLIRHVTAARSRYCKRQ